MAGPKAQSDCSARAGRLAVEIGAIAALAVYVLFSAAERITHGFIAYYGAARLLTLVTLILSARAPARLWLAAGVCLSELTLPVAAEQHFVSLAIPLVLLWPQRVSRAWVAFFAAFAALFLIPLDYTAHRFTSGWAVLLGYPRLYAAWLLWIAAVVAMRHTRESNLHAPS